MECQLGVISLRQWWTSKHYWHHKEKQTLQNIFCCLFETVIYNNVHYKLVWLDLFPTEHGNPVCNHYHEINLSVVDNVLLGQHSLLLILWWCMQSKCGKKKTASSYVFENIGVTNDFGPSNFVNIY